MKLIDSKTLVPLLLIILIAGGCSIWKKDDPDKEIRVFLTEFEKSLSGDDESVLKQFEAHQSKESILSAIHVLQNKELDHLHCTSHFSNASISHEAAGIRIEVPVSLNTENLIDTISQETSIVLWVEPDHGHLVISKLEGDTFYNAYLNIKYQVNFSLNKELELADRKQFFETAHALQQKYDTIIWYVHYDAKTYYYAVAGKWNNYFIGNEEKPINYTMGLVDEKGNIVVPLEYDLVGTPGMIESDIIEVKKDGLVGFYNMNGNQLIAPQYDWIIPYENENVYALVKRDTTYGWLSKNSYTFQAGFPSEEARRYIKDFEFLPSQFTLSNKDQSMAEIPTDEYIGYGILMPPTYWTSTKIFTEIMPGFTKGENLYTGYREYITADHSFVETVANNLGALITTIKERYLEGREEFYEHNQITFVNAKGETLTTDDLYGTGEVNFKKIDSTLLEIQVIESNTVDFDQPDNGDEWNIPSYMYYSLDHDLSVQRLTSNRRFIQTEFIKLDSGYLSGSFTFFNPETQTQDTRSFLSDNTLAEMRNEILASYGYIFKDEETSKQFSYREWYKPHYETYNDFADQLTDIDRHNLAFLEKIIGSLDANPI